MSNAIATLSDVVVPLVTIPSLILAPAWVIVTRMKIRHGYPLGTRWGQPILPHNTTVAEERISLLTTENAQLRAEVGAVKDRLATIERIVTDRSFTLDHEIERLRGPAN